MIDVRRHMPALTDALGARFEIVEEDDSFVRLQTDLVELTIHYDPRDQILISMIRPRGVPDELADYCQVPILLELLGFFDDAPQLQTNYLNDLEREIACIGIVMRGIYLVGLQRIRDASFFNQGYNAGYTSISPYAVVAVSALPPR